MDAARRTLLIEAIARNVPAITLRNAILEVGVVQDYDQKRKSLSDDPATAPVEFVGKIVESHEQLGYLPQLFDALAKRCYLDDQCYVTLSAFISDVHGIAANKQGAIALRANTLSNRKLREFLDQIEGKLCVVAATLPGQQPITGTGMLVGPDLVLTAYHTLKGHILDKQARSVPNETLYAIFDHLDGSPITDPEALPPNVLRVPFHDEWLVECCSDMDRDGLFRDPDPLQLAALPNCLDFALVRLAQPVGRHARRFSGGSRRAWCDIREPTSSYMQHDRIIIPQHPYGHPQQIDFGRYSKVDSDYDTSQTRIRYDTETAEGTSGAPCFNQNFKFVGLHNARFTPENFQLNKNQAIRADRILGKVNGAALAPPPQSEGRMWSISEDRSTPRTIIGRQNLLDWIDQASRDGRVERPERTYIALGEHANSGKTFSAEILMAARRLSSDPIVALGNGDQIPVSAADFLKTVGYQLRLDAAMFERMPLRPTLDRQPVASGPQPVAVGSMSMDRDKLEKWISDDLPVWFNDALAQRRVQPVDVKEEARSLIAQLQRAGIEVPAELVTRAESGGSNPEFRTRWQRLWIVLDNLDKTPLSAEVSELIAGLMGLHRSDNVLPAELQGIRWVFLGQAPEFLLPLKPLIERLVPHAIGSKEMVEAMKNLVRGFDQPVEEAELIVEAMLKGWMASQPELEDPRKRLVVMQGYLNTIATILNGSYGVKQ